MINLNKNKYGFLSYKEVTINENSIREAKFKKELGQNPNISKKELDQMIIDQGFVRDKNTPNSYIRINRKEFNDDEIPDYIEWWDKIGINEEICPWVNKTYCRKYGFKFHSSGTVEKYFLTKTEWLFPPSSTNEYVDAILTIQADPFPEIKYFNTETLFKGEESVEEKIYLSVSKDVILSSEKEEKKYKFRINLENKKLLEHFYVKIYVENSDLPIICFF